VLSRRHGKPADRAEQARFLVVEHDPAVIRSADHLLDLGPGAGELGGHVLAAGTVAQVTTWRRLRAQAITIATISKMVMGAKMVTGSR